MQTACRNCGSRKERAEFCNLGYQPLANSYLSRDQLEEPEAFYPLVPTICPDCALIQLPNLAAREDIFEDYAYFSSQSDGWVKHVHDYANKMVGRLGLNENSRILEVASNDGAMLREFRALGVPAVGIEPAKNIARIAQLDGLATIDSFMGVDFAQELLSSGYQGAHLIAANNVMAHVPDLDDFLTGIRMLLAPSGVFTVEFPDAENLVRDNQFDTIYHEHFSYFTKHSAFDALARRGLGVVDSEDIDIHGGSIRLYARPDVRLDLPGEHVQGPAFGQPTAEQRAFYDKPAEYRRELWDKLNRWKREGKKIVGYGAPAKGNTMLNYCGIDAGILDYVVDSTPEKIGKFLPGSRIPIVNPAALALDPDPPDVIVILAWNWQSEISKKLKSHKDRGAIILSRLEEL